MHGIGGIPSSVRDIISGVWGEVLFGFDLG